MTRNQLLARITKHYLESRDFNGLPVDQDTPRGQVEQLIRTGLVSLNRGDRHPNPHVKAFAPEPVDEQLRKIAEAGIDGCLYPEPIHLEKVVNKADYEGRPFSRCLALGEPQLSFKVFDLNVLEHYRNDPRYYFTIDDLHGRISVHDDVEMRERDEIFLQTFGFAYDDNMNRAVAVFLRYLRRLTPEHQRLWEARLLEGEYDLHPDYWANAMGIWTHRVSIFVAFAEEMTIINKMCRLMGRAQLFRSEVGGGSRPREFAFLLRPTQKAFHEFVLCLDKMISENIDINFFGLDVSAERERTRSDGKIVVERKGSLQMLAEWLEESVELVDPKPKDDMLATFRKIRKMRQAPAHRLGRDIFDQALFREQRQLMLKAYAAVRTLRLILANHPASEQVEVPDWLYKGEILSY
jgi:hypothetical protein